MLAELAHLVRGLAGADAEGPGVHRLLGDADHGRDLLCGGRPLVGLGPHDEAAHRAVAHLGQHVHPEGAAPEVPEVVGEALPGERAVALEGSLGHLLGRVEEPHEVVLIIPADRRQGVAAVAHEDGRGSVHARGVGARVPHELGVVVGVGVDEPGSDDLSLCVDRAPGRPLDGSDGGDAAVFDGQVTAEGRAPGPVDDQGVSDHHVIGHCRPPRPRSSSWLRRTHRRPRGCRAGGTGRGALAAWAGEVAASAHSWNLPRISASLRGSSGVPWDGSPSPRAPPRSSA